VILFPIFYNIPNCSGWTTLHNFPPNSWELGSVGEKFIYVVWTDGSIWNSKLLSKIQPNESKNINFSEVSSFIPKDTMPLLVMTSQGLPGNFEELDFDNQLGSSWPMWRATLGFGTPESHTSYQGEVVPFRVKGTLLSFFPFYQARGFLNFLILINVEFSPEIRDAKLDIYSLSNERNILSEKVTSNNISVIDLSKLSVDDEEVLVCVSKDISAIPLMLSIDNHGRLVSLEHTHPPSSYSILGNRFGVQSALKQLWFNRLN